MQWDTNSKVSRSSVAERLPQEKRDAWTLRGAQWEEYTEDERRRWREWFAWAVSPQGEFWDARRGRAVVSSRYLRCVDFSGMRLAGVVFDRCNLMGAEFAGADLTAADLASCSLERARFGRACMIDANLSNARLDHADFTGADLSGARIHRTDLTRVDFRDARLFGTRITEPVWHFVLPRVTWSGGIVFQPGLFEHPVGDVQGLPPILRRQIADVQHLRDMHRNAGPVGRGVMWLWGMSCGFGQDMARLGVACVGLFLLFTLMYMQTDFALTEYLPNGNRQYTGRPTFFQALYFTMTTFTTPGISGFFPVGAVGRTLTTIQGLLCFLMLGGVLSIFSNKLARLA